jgi:hypothetical protein
MTGGYIRRTSVGQQNEISKAYDSVAYIHTYLHAAPADFGVDQYPFTWLLHLSGHLKFLFYSDNTATDFYFIQ